MKVQGFLSFQYQIKTTTRLVLQLGREPGTLILIVCLLCPVRI